MKKLIAYSLISCMTFSMFSQNVCASVLFTDTNGHWAESAIDKWSQLGIINGNDNLFKPNENITRGDVSVILDRIMGYELSSTNTFSDLDTRYYTDSLLKSNYAGIILGSNSLIRPKDDVTREEVAVMICRAMHFDTTNYTSTTFTDNNSISSWAVSSVAYLCENGIVNGKSNNLFDPSAPITRAETVSILDRAIKSYINNDEMFTEDVLGNVVINTENATLVDMHITGDLILSEGIKNGDVVLDNVEVDGNITIKGGGQNSIYFSDVIVNGDIIISKQNSTVRVVVTGKSSASLLKIQSDAIINTNDLYSGFIEEISIENAENVQLIGNFNKISNNISDTEIFVVGFANEIELNSNAILNEKAYYSGVTLYSVSNFDDSILDGIPKEDEINEYNISINSNISNGSISANQSNAKEGDIVTVSSNASDGYKLSNITILDENNNKIEITDNAFIMPNQNVTISATFTSNNYNLTIVNPSTGTIEISPNIGSVGDTITVTATAIEGYALDAIYVNNTAISGNTFVMPSEDVTITASFIQTATLSEIIADVLNYTNEYRASKGLSPVVLNDELSKVAQAHADDMYENNYLDHTGLNGSTIATRILSGGLTYISCSENIAKGPNTPYDVVQSWINSEGHEANMVGNYDYIGIGYNGSYWVQCFLTY